MFFIAVGVLVFVTSGANAEGKQVTVAFLMAAASSLPDHADVSFNAIYDVQRGMVEPKSWNMKGRGLSRFSLKDPHSQVVFENVYCAQDSKPFKELVNLESNKMIHVSGYKDSGENNQASIYVTSVEVVPDPVVPAPEEKAAITGSFRVILKDTVSGTKTVLANVVPGRTYAIDNLVVTLEVEKVLQSETSVSGASKGEPGR